MIILDIPQGTTDWLVARLPRLTASALKPNITATGKLSKSIAATAAIDKLIAGIELASVMYKRRDEIAGMEERDVQNFMAHYTGDKFKGSLHTERGQDSEPDAIAALSERIGKPIVDAGMCIMGDDPDGVVSCSPDGLVYEKKALDAGVEVKCPMYATYLNIVASDVLPSDYKLQVHSSMIICGVDTWHFGAYFKGKPLFYKEVKRDLFTDAVEESLTGFLDQYRERFDEVHNALFKLNATKL